MAPCPRCARENPATAATCAGCGIPLAFVDDPPPSPLGMVLDLDRRRRGPDRTPGEEPGALGPGPEGPGGRMMPPAFEPDHSDWKLGVVPEPPPDAGDGPGLRPASRARRAVAWAIDAALLAVAAAAVPAVLFASSGVAVGLGTNPSALGSGLRTALALSEAFVGVVAFVYATASHALGGATLGKRFAGIRVVGPDGLPPAPAVSAKRSAWALLSLVPLGLGLLPALLTPSRRALHDLLAGTRVVEGP